MLGLSYCSREWIEGYLQFTVKLAFGLGMDRKSTTQGRCVLRRATHTSIGSKLSLELPTLELVGKRRTKPSTQLSALVK